MESLIKSSFLELLEDQSTLSFNGRINAFKKENHQLMASVLMKDGHIIDAHYANKKGERALEKIITEDSLHNSLQFITEPEEIDRRQGSRDLSFQEVYELFQSTIKRVTACQKLRPPDHIRLAIQSEFIFAGDEISAEEFDLLCIISDYSRVSDIYAQGGLSDDELTMALVTLRKKNAVRVLGS